MRSSFDKNAKIKKYKYAFLVSFLRKVMLGKRVMMVGFTELFILLFVLSIIGFGVIGGGGESTEDSWMIAVLALGYFPAANIIVNRRLADCSANAFIIAALPAAVIAFVEFIISCISGAPAASSSFMSTPAQLAAFLLCAGSLCIYYISVSKGVRCGVYSGLLFAIIAGLFATWCAPVLIILPLSAVLYLVLRHTSAPRELLLIICAIPLLVFCLPADVLYNVSSFFRMQTPLGEMRGRLIESVRLFLDNAIMGLGADAAVSESGEVNYFNLLLGIGCRFGAFAVAALLLLVLFKLRRNSVYSRFLKHSSLNTLSGFTLIAVFSMIMLGWFYDIAEGVELYFVVFVILGMNTSSLRVAKKEYDDMQGYFGDNIGIDSSVADITLKK